MRIRGMVSQSPEEEPLDIQMFVGHGGSVVGLSAFRLEGHRFESHSSRHIGTLDKSFTRSCS